VSEEKVENQLDPQWCIFDNPFEVFGNVVKHFLARLMYVIHKLKLRKKHINNQL